MRYCQFRKNCWLLCRKNAQISGTLSWIPSFRLLNMQNYFLLILAAVIAQENALPSWRGAAAPSVLPCVLRSCQCVNVHNFFLYVFVCICVCRIILESDPILVAQRVAFRSDDIPLGEQTVASVCCTVLHFSLIISILRCSDNMLWCYPDTF